MNKTLILMVGAMLATSLFAQDTLDRTRRPGPGPVPVITLPQIQKATLRNGLAVWLVERHELPLVAFNLVITAGADRDPLDRPGIATMTAEVLDAGTSTLDALQIADRFDAIGATFAVRAGFDATFASLNTLTKHLDDALQTFADVLTDPTFPQKEFDRLRKQRITSLLQQKDRAATIATLAFNHIIYGSEHPYGNDPQGSEASLKGLTRDDLMTFYAAYYRPNNATLIVVGDVTLGDITARLEKSLGGWKSAAVPPPHPAAIPPAGPRRVYLVDKPAAPQSEIRIGAPSLARSTPDFFPVTVMNRLLGGQFSSWLNLNLREKHGFTYGARSQFTFNKQPGPFVASAGVVSAKTDSALHEFLFEIDRMHGGAATAAEIDFARKGLTGGFALGFETPAQIAGALQNLVLYGLPDDYYQTYLQNIQKVSVDEVKRVAARYLDTSKMAVVIVGDVASIREGVGKLGLGETEIRDTRGNPLPR